MYAILLNCTLKNSKNGKFCNYIYFATIKKLNDGQCDDENKRDKAYILAIWEQPFCSHSIVYHHADTVS